MSVTVLPLLVALSDTTVGAEFEQRQALILLGIVFFALVVLVIELTVRIFYNHGAQQRS